MHTAVFTSQTKFLKTHISVSFFDTAGVGFSTRLMIPVSNVVSIRIINKLTFMHSKGIREEAWKTFVTYKAVS